MVKLFDRRGKVIARKKIKCHICGVEKEMTWDEFAKHIKAHIRNGEVSGGIVGECVEWGEKNGTRTFKNAKGSD